MVKFAHIADVHLGAFRDQRLREMNLKAFGKALDECARQNVDFVIIAGDLFDVNIPDLGIVEKAVQKMKALQKPVYVVYGSHDYSPTQTSVIDVLNEAGVLKKVSSGEYVDGKLKLDFVEDEKTKAKITGISARKLGLEKTYFKDLDAGALEHEQGYKIFVFHCAVAEHKPSSLQKMDATPLSLFPKGFDYYAGGHVHHRFVSEYGKGKIAEPGPLFAADFRDLDGLAEENHGFFLVENGNMQFVPVRVCQVRRAKVGADGLTAEEAGERIRKACGEVEKGDVVLLHVRGKLKHGKPSDIKWSEIREMLERKCPILYVNRSGLETEEREASKVDAQHPDEIAEKVFKESLADTKYSEELKGEKGLAKSNRLLGILKEENAGETKKKWEEMINERGKVVLA
ncbi:exonuclease SbcCD subunit D [Candidatus Micrarchaeota archaeon]|nr:exonuclease SbcCD subunit D [Candidatus Micrarchaeota archaeon]